MENRQGSKTPERQLVLPHTRGGMLLNPYVPGCEIKPKRLLILDFPMRQTLEQAQS